MNTGSGDGMRIYNLSGLDKFLGAIDKFAEKKEFILTKLGQILQEKIQDRCPVDSGWLRAHIYVGKPTQSTVEVGTNIKYAQWVNDGHRQRRRWLPCTVNADGRLVYKRGAETGVMLRERFVEGKKFFEHGYAAAKPLLERFIERCMEELRREAEGAGA